MSPRCRRSAGRAGKVAGLALAAAAGFAGTVRTAQQPAARPNLLVVTLDTLRADRLGCYGYAGARTPVLDALAGEGVRFERAFSPVPLTLPSHCSIMTGTYPSYHGVRDNSGFVLPPDQVTLAETLGGAGYATGAFIGAFVLDSKFGLNQGFDRYYDDFDLSRFENVSPGYIQRTGDQVVAEAIRWLDQQNGKGKPIFLWAHLYDPHDPYDPPEPFRSRNADPYDGEIEFTDTNLGTLLAWFRTHGLYDNTLIVVAGDHGESLGEHGESKHGFFIYNATLHVPLIMKLPAGGSRGKTIPENVSLVDLFPTILQILATGKSAGPQVQGKGLLSLVLGKSSAERPDVYAESYYPRLQFGWSELRALITDRYKYVLSPRPELYDLREDFRETRDQSAQRTALAGQMKDRLRSLIARTRAARENTQARAGLDAQTREKLRSLGYISYSMGSGGLEEHPDLADPKDQIGNYNELTDLFEMSARGEYAAVLPRYRRLVQSQPGLKIAHYKLGQACFQTGDYEGALASYRKAIELGGDAALATYDLALTYLKLRRVEDAIVGFRRTIELDPEHYRARTNLGLLLRERGMLGEAVEQLETAIRIAPTSIIALSNLAIAYSLAGRHEAAEKTMRKAVEISPKDGLLRANLAAVLQRMGKTEEARREMETARKLDPRIGNRTQPP